MKTENLMKLKRAVASGIAEQELQNVCRSIVKDELSDVLNGKLRETVSVLVNYINIPVLREEMDTTSKKRDNSVMRHKDFMLVVICALLCFIFVKIMGSCFWGCLLSVVISSAICLWFRRNAKAEQSAVSHLYNYRSVNEMSSSIDVLVRCLQDILGTDLRPMKNSDDVSILERRPYRNLLERVFEDLKDAEKPREVERLSEIFEDCGYELRDYSVEYGEMFEKSSANVPEPKTTVKAMVNSRTGNCVFMGKVVFPQE